ncbi:DNA polymerase III subunit delta [Hydrogenobacter thermophilus]|uniref:DNA polymerase III subunit delta n=1 Tax=Hydrogenobacter thermophilus TaxID=940 RepID=UPI0030F56192
MNLLEYQKGLENREIKPLNIVQSEDEYVLKTFTDKLSSLYEVKLLWGDELERKSFFSMLTEGEMFTRKKKVFVVKKGEEFLKSVKDGAYFVSLAKKLNKVSVFFVISEKINKSQLEKEPLKTILSIGDFLEAKSPDKRKVRELVKSRFVKEGRDIDESALEYLLEITSYNLVELKNEVDKLLLYKEGKITLEDVKSVCFSSAEYTIFDFINAFYTKDMEKSLVYLSSLLKSGISPLQIQAILINYSIRLFVASTSARDQTDKDKIFTELSLNNPYLRHSFKIYMEKFTAMEVKNLILKLHTLDIAEKVYFADPQESLKNFVIEYLRYAGS